MTSTPAYYLIMIGGSLTIITAVVILIGGTLNTYYARFFPIFANLNQITAFALTMLPGLAVLYLGQRFLIKPKTQLQSGLAIAAVSIVSLVGIVGSGVSVYVGILFSGPPISFTGGITGAFLSRAGESLPSPPNPQTEEKGVRPGGLVNLGIRMMKKTFFGAAGESDPSPALMRRKPATRDVSNTHTLSSLPIA